MSIFDLLLILLVLGTAAALLVALIALFLGRWGLPSRLMVAVLAAWAIYLGVGTAVAVSTPQRTIPVGQDRCFDEMCFAVTGFRHTAAIESAGTEAHANGDVLIVNVRISNRSRGHAQREAGRKGMLLDEAGRFYPPSREGMLALSRAQGSLPGLDAAVDPGQSLTTQVVFDVPPGIHRLGFVLGSDLAFNPARIVIADDAHFLHKATIVPLD